MESDKISSLKASLNRSSIKISMSWILDNTDGQGFKEFERLHDLRSSELPVEINIKNREVTQ